MENIIFAVHTPNVNALKEFLETEKDKLEEMAMMSDSRHPTYIKNIRGNNGTVLFDTNNREYVSNLILPDNVIAKET